MAYSIGVDYGTGSGRVVLLDIEQAIEVAVAVVPYRHGVIVNTLPSSGQKLDADWALQHPDDYVEVLTTGIPVVLREAGIHSSDVVGLGVDFTSCTVLPVDAAGQPLCLTSEWADHPHAWPKLWKHHAAQPIADRINKLAEQRGEAFLSRYGGRISSEWYFPKLLEVFENDRDVYDACSAFIEATDWIVWYLTGSECRNSCTAGYKAMWSEEDGLPDDSFFRDLNPEFDHPSAKLGSTFLPLGTRAGSILEDVANQLGLSTNVSVAVGNVDAMASVPSVGVRESGKMVMVMGTSTCHMVVSEQEVRLPGVTGVVKGGALPDLYAYEAGQAAVGDMFEWFVKQIVPHAYESEAKDKGVTIYELLEAQAADLAPGENGVIALDWWNGNRSILADADLSGVMTGLTLATTPADIYRALLEATAFGAKRIVDNFSDHGISIDTLVACGGLPQKSPLLMQMYADVCGLPVIVRNSKEIPARGAAMFGAVAAGAQNGGFDTIDAAIERLAAPVLRRYEPNTEATAVYDKMYRIYYRLYSYFGEEHVNDLHELKDIRLKASV